MGNHNMSERFDTSEGPVDRSNARLALCKSSRTLFQMTWGYLDATDEPRIPT